MYLASHLELVRASDEIILTASVFDELKSEFKFSDLFTAKLKGIGEVAVVKLLAEA